MIENEEGTPVVEDHPADGVVVLRLNRPAKLNAFNLEMRDALQVRLSEAKNDPAIRAVVLAGSPRAFVAGADIAAVARSSREEMERARLHYIWAELDSFPKPLLMAARGYCLGAGCELLMHGDITIVSEEASIGQPEVKVGIQPGAGGLGRMVRLVGYHRAMLLAMTGEPILGRDAAAWGLVSQACADQDVENHAISLAVAIAALPADRMCSIKMVAKQGLDLPLSEQIDNERRAYWKAFGTQDQREGMAAFLERRPPIFNRLSDDD